MEQKNERKIFRVFFSSSFKDMHAERDYLRDHAFRRLDLRLREYGYSLFVMDLRGSSENDDAVSFEERVLRMCLRRVTDCKPRMIGLIGDRYGWIFLKKQSQYADKLSFIRAQKTAFDIADRHSLPRGQMEGISVTQLEILHGLNQTDTSKCFFYFRDALPYQSMPPQDKSVFSPDNPERTMALKSYIYSTVGEKYIKNYSPLYRPGAPLSRLEELDKMVYDDLWGSFYSEIQENADKAVEPHQAYLNQKALFPVKLPAYGKILDTVTGGENVLIEGGAGSGKSVLMGQLYAEIKTRGETIAFCCGLNAASRRESEMLFKLYQQLSQLLGKAPVSSFPENLKEQRLCFLSLLEEHANNTRSGLHVFIDSIDSLQTSSGSGNSLAFLPNEPLSGVCFVLSAKPGAVFYNGKLRLHTEKLDKFTEETARRMVQSISELFAKGLDRDVLRAVSARVVEAGGLPLYARILTEHLCQMTGADYNAFSGDDAHIKWMLSQTRQMPGAIPAAYSKILQRARDVYGDQAVWILRLVAVSRSGLPDSLLLAAAAEVTSGVSDISAFEIRDFFFGHLRQDTDLSWWEFEHQQFRECLLSSMSEEEKKHLHAILTKQLDSLPDAADYRMSEYLYHCNNASLINMAVNFIAKEGSNYASFDPVLIDTFEYDDSNNGSFIEDLLNAAQNQSVFDDPGKQSEFYVRLLVAISAQLKGETVSFKYLDALIGSAVKCVKKYQFSESKRDCVLYPLGLFLNGWILELSGDLSGASEKFRHSNSLLEAQVQRGLISRIATTIYIQMTIRLGNIAYSNDDLFSARYYYELAREVVIAVRKKSEGECYDDLIKLEIFLARVSEKEHKEDESKEHYLKAVSLCEQVGNDPAVTQIMVTLLHEAGELFRGFRGTGDSCLSSYKIAKEEYLARQDDVTALLAYTDACSAAAEALSDTGYALEAFSLLSREYKNNPDRPKIAVKLIEITVTLAELDTGSSALGRCNEVINLIGPRYSETSDLVFSYLMLLTCSIELCGKENQIENELELREKTIEALKDKWLSDSASKEILTNRIVFLWETISFCENKLKDDYKAAVFALELEDLLMTVHKENLADTPELKAQLGGKLFGLGYMYYREHGGENQAFRLWELSADVFDELNLYYPGNPEYIELRKRALGNIVEVLSYNRDKREKEWRKRLKRNS